MQVSALDPFYIRFSIFIAKDFIVKMTKLSLSFSQISHYDRL